MRRSIVEEKKELKNKIQELRRQQIQIQNQIQKQEENNVYDESLYDDLNVLEEEVATCEDKLNMLT